ncbi:hypothetical protein [Haloferula sargassicola]
MMRTLVPAFLALMFVSPLVAEEHREAVRELSKQAQATLKLLEAERFANANLYSSSPKRNFDLVRDRLETLGITVRLLHYGDRRSSNEETDPTPLRNIPIRNYMSLFQNDCGWGWIVYPDGSITYFDNVCSGNWPKDGTEYHEAQYRAGSPEVMAAGEKDLEIRNKKG